MVGIEPKEKAQPLFSQADGRRRLAMPAGATVIRFLPPLTISRQNLDVVADALLEVVRKTD
jgi:acetylornithine/LysW-gamma-L-lysine aminotransferase